MSTGKKTDKGKFNAAASATGDTELMTAVQDRDLDRVKALVTGGAPVDETNFFGNTALHYAAANGQIEIVRYLRDMGADINKRNSTGATPFFLAVINSQVETGVRLALMGADKSIPGHQDHAPYEHAKEIGLGHVVEGIETILSTHHANRTKLAMSHNKAKR